MRHGDEPALTVLVERDVELGACLHEAKERVPGGVAGTAAVPQGILRLVTVLRMSFSDPLGCGISGRSPRHIVS
jgi:hypothetical protein